MAWHRALSRPIALLVVLSMLAEPGFRTLFAAEDRKTDITALGMLAPPAGGAGPTRPASHLPVGFDDIGTFHEGLVTDSEGYFRLEHQDIAIPGRGPSLEVRRIYNSFVKRESAFGRSWGWNYGVRLVKEDEDTGNPVIIEPDNLRVHFRPEGSGFVSVNGALRERLVLGSPSVRTSASGLRQYFGSGGRLIAIEDAGGRRLELEYDGKKVVRAVDSAGRSLAFEYAGDRISKITDPIGREWSYDYDGEKLVAAIDPLGRKMRYRHLPKFGWGERMSHVHFPNGAEMTIYYHPLSKRVVELSGPGRMTSRFRFSVNAPAREMRRWSWDPRGNRSETEFHGAALETEETGEGSKKQDLLFIDKKSIASMGYLANVTKRTDPEGGESVVAASESEVVIEDPKGRTTRIRKDADGRVASVTDPMGNVSEVAWDAATGKVARITGAAGRSISFSYADGELRSITDSAGHTTRIEPVGENGHRLVDATGLETFMEADRYGYPKRIRDPAGVERTLEFDAVGRLLSATDAEGATMTFRYDAADNLVETGPPASEGDRPAARGAPRTPALGSVKIDYDSLDRPVRVIDARGGVSRYEYDERGLLVASTDPSGARVEYERGRSGNLVATKRMKDGRELIDRYEYDDNGLLERTIDPLGRETLTDYDRTGLPKSVKTPGGGEIAYRHDDAGRRVLESFPDGSSIAMAYGSDLLLESLTYRGSEGELTTRIEHDANGRPIALSTEGREFARTEYDPVGRILALRTPGSVLAYEYEGGRIVAAREGEGEGARVWRYEFDSAGSLAATTLPTGDRRAYGFDGQGRLRSIEASGLGAIAIESDESDAITAMRFPSGVAVAFRYDDLGRVASIEHRTADGSIAYARTFAYDALGNLERLGENGVETRYEYDDGERLIGVERPGGAERYAYDAENNLTEAVGLRGEDAVLGANRVVSLRGAPWRYDARGNVVERGPERFGYDDGNRLVRVESADGVTAEYAYDALGRRVRKSVAGEVTQYIYDGADLVAELDGEGKVLARYVHGPGTDQLLAMERDGKWYTFVADPLGTVHALLDDQGRTVESYRYTAYGVPLDDSFRPAADGTRRRLHPFGFAGREYDAETGLYQFRARYYDPILGRFLQRDPAGLAAGPNLYAYALGNPVSIRDSTGLAPEWVEEVQEKAKAVWDKNNPITFYAGDLPEHYIAPRLRVRQHNAGLLYREARHTWLRQEILAKKFPPGILDTRVASVRSAGLRAEFLSARRMSGFAGKWSSGMQVIGVASHGYAWGSALGTMYRHFRYGEESDALQAVWPIIENWLWFGASKLLLSGHPWLMAAGALLIAILAFDSFAEWFSLEQVTRYLWALDFRGLLEYLGILNADPTYVQPLGVAPPLPDRWRPRVWIGASGAAARPLLFYDSGGGLIGLRVPPGRLADAKFAIDPATGALSDVAADTDAPVIGRFGLAREGDRFRVDLEVAEPNLDRVVIRAHGAGASVDLLQLAAPLPAGSIHLDPNDFPPGVSSRAEAVARDLAGNESVLGRDVEFAGERPLLSGLEASATAEVFESEVARDRPEEGEPAPAAAALDPSSADVRPAWIDGRLPEGATAIGEWGWGTAIPFGGSPSHTGASAEGTSLHYFIRASRPLPLTPQENLVQYVHLDPENPPEEILIQLYREGELGEHRVYWGDDLIDLGGEAGTASLFRAGALPEPGRWTRLSIPVDRFGLGEAVVTGMLFGQAEGRAIWGPTTKCLAEQDRAPAVVSIDDPRARAATLPYEIDAALRFRLLTDARARAWVEDAAGAPVATLLDGALPAGRHELSWDGIGSDGSLVPDGSYTFAVEAMLSDDSAPARASAPFAVSTLIAGIALPSERALVQATVPVFGDAAGRDFERYELAVATSDEPEEWRIIADGRQPEVVDEPPIPLDSRATIRGNLGSFEVPGSDGQNFDWSRSEFADHHTIRLRVWGSGGEVAEDRVRVRVGHVASNGGPMTVTSRDGRARLLVPPLSMRHPLHLFHLAAAEPAIAPALAEAAARQGGEIVGGAVELHPAGVRFLRPAWIQLVAPEGRTDVALHVLDPAGGGWRRLDDPRVLPSEEGLPARISARIDALPAGRAIFAAIADRSTHPPLLLEPPAIARRVDLIAIAEPFSSVEIRDEAGNAVGSSHADGSGLARFEGIHLRDGESRFVAHARDAAGHEASSAAPLRLAFEPPAAPELRSLALEQEGDSLVIVAHAEDSALRRAEIRVRSESDPEGFYVSAERGASGSAEGLMARVTLAAASDPGRVVLAARRPGERVAAAAPGAAEASMELRDLAPPGAPRIESSTHAALSLSDVPLEVPPPALRELLRGPVDLRRFPVLSFRYRIEPDSTIHLVAKVGDTWRGIALVGERFWGWSAAGGERVESARELELEDDGQWHDAHIDLYGALRGEAPKEESTLLESLLVGEWEYTGYKEITPVDPDRRGEYELAEVRLRSAAGSSPVELSWSDPADLSGISEYAYLLDDAPRTVPVGTGLGKPNRASLQAPPGEGTAYFHLRARDGAGHWGETAHFPVTVDDAGPIASSPSPPPDSEAGHSQIRLVIRDEGSGVEPDSIRLTVDGKEYALANGLSFDARIGLLDFIPWSVEPPIPAWPAGKRVHVALTAAADYADNPLREPFSWSYTFGRAPTGAGGARMITTEGGIEPAWSPDGTSIAYVAETPERTLRVLSIAGGADLAIECGLRGVATPSWSPDGATIAVAATDETGRSGIHFVDAKSGEVRSFAGEGRDSDPAFLRDGRLLFVRDGALCVLSADLAEIRVLVDDPEGARAVRPQPSADGKSVLFGRSLYDEQVWRLDLADPLPAPFLSAGNPLDPAWGREGEVIYAARTDACRLERASREGEPLGPVFEAGGWWDRYPRVSPDGRAMVFQSTRNGFWNLWVVEWLSIRALGVTPQAFTDAGEGGPAPEIEIGYDASGFVRADVRILDPAGRQVFAIPIDAAQLAGPGRVTWNGRGATGERLAEGTYAVRLVAYPPSGGSPVEREAAVTIGEESVTRAVDRATAPAAEDGSLALPITGGLVLAGAILLLLLFLRRRKGGNDGA